MSSSSGVALDELYRVLAEEAFMGFMTFDVTSEQCLFLNRLAKEMIECQDEEQSKILKLTQISPEEGRGHFRPFSPQLVVHDGLYQDVLIRKLTQGTFVANVGVKHLALGDRQLLVLMIQDVTLQKKLQRELMTKQIEIKGAYEELLKQNRQLKELDLAKNRFIALTTHELRTPLSAMVSSAEILHMGLYDNPTQMKEFIDMIYEQGLHLVELVNDILDFAKIQAGRMDFFIEETSPEELLKSLGESFAPMAEGQKVVLEVKPSSTPPVAYFDRLRLQQVLSNIINNAIKYNREGGKVEIWTETTEDVVKVFVKDSGRGIPPEQQDLVFNEFETLGQVALHHKGTGLGMPISRRLMEGMGGRLLLSSEVGVGSTFWVEIPRQKVLAEDVYRVRPGAGDGIAA